ncbi:hypothetical protein HHI36_003358 [Cryptolaemus montrouzieri]|uniref:Uncharacterized protein n=1 Tax=Cryptolaemus montrouzieri TaxID=559131 RepID=A0ABD2PD76_9CUCU
MMNLNLLSVALVLIVISTSASVYINEELPLYLSDDIIVSKVKRSVTKDAANPVSHDTNDSDKAKVEAETTTKDNPAKKELTNEESGLVFLPSFGRRTRRNIVKREITDNDSLKTNDSLVVTERNEELTNPEDRQESGLVFLPSFGRRNRRSLAKRSPPSRDDDYIQKTKTTNTQETENESEDEQESGLVFIPSFGRRTKRNISKRDVSSNKDQNKKMITQE